MALNARCLETITQALENAQAKKKTKRGLSEFAVIVFLAALSCSRLAKLGQYRAHCQPNHGEKEKQKKRRKKDTGVVNETILELTRVMYLSARSTRQLPELQPLYAHAKARFSECPVYCTSTDFPCPMCHEAPGSRRGKRKYGSSR